MPDYLHRKIELTPRRQADGTWLGPYRIIEFRPTSWRYHSGCADGSFASRENAEAAVLAVAKRIVDSLESPMRAPQSHPSLLARLYGNRMSKLPFSLLHEFQNMGKSRG